MREAHYIYGLTHPELAHMGILYVGSDKLSGSRFEQHVAGISRVVSRGCSEFGVEPALLEAHILAFWRKENPEDSLIKSYRAVGQAEFNAKHPYAISTEYSCNGGRKGGLASSAKLTPEQRSERARKAGSFSALTARQSS